jgi:hypothetical protein
LNGNWVGFTKSPKKLKEGMIKLRRNNQFIPLEISVTYDVRD